MTQLKRLKKPVAIIVALMLLISCVVVEGTVIANENTNIWTGGTAAPTKGSGTVDDPYLIETAEQFAYMMLEVNGGADYDNGATYKLMTDIYLNDISKINWATGEVKSGYTPNVWEPEYFSGIIYGNGHMVYGMYIERNPEAYTEVWGQCTGAALISENWQNKWIQINDMGMDYVYVNSPNVSGVFVAGTNVGNVTTGNIPKYIFNGCYIGSNVTVKGFAAGGFVGGGYGTKILAEIKNCASLTTGYDDNGRNKTGAMFGDVWGGSDDKIDNCYSVTSICGNNQPGGSFTNNYGTFHRADTATTVVTLANMQGLDALTDETKMPGLGTGFLPTKTFPVPAALYDTLVDEEIETGKVWDGTTSYPIVGEGTETSPYEIATAEQLAYVVSSGGGAHYKLVADIYLNDTSKVDWSTGTAAEGHTPNSWYVGKTFSGTIDGDGHIVYGLYLNSTADKSWGWNGCGLIPKVASGQTAVLKNLGIKSAYINCSNVTGAFFGGNNGVAEAEQCFVGGDVTLCGYETGAFLGLSDGVFKFNDCYSLATVKQGIEGDSACDTGLVGEFYSFAGSGSVEKSSVTNCYNANGGGSTKSAPGTVSNVYTTVSSKFGTVLTADKMQGTVFSGNELALTDAFVATETYPALAVFTGGDSTVWDGLARNFDRGDGESADTAYEISSAGQLAYAVATGGGGKYYKLTDDIYINELEKIDWSTGLVKEGVNYTPNYWFVGSGATGNTYNGFSEKILFKGTVDGNGHTVYGFLNENGTDATTGGIFPAAEATAVKDLVVSHSYITSGRFTGPISSLFSGTLTNVVVDETVYVYGTESINHESSSLGGLVGYTNGITLKNCAFTGNLTATSAVHHVYGLVGTSWGTSIVAESCFAVGRQPFTTSVGSKTFDSVTAAETYYQGLYKVTDVYTDSYVKDNKVSYTYGSDKTAGTFSVFTFTKLDTVNMTGLTALDNMPALDKNVWSAAEGRYPTLRELATVKGDVDGDGIFATTKDILSHRTTLIGAASYANTDTNSDGVTDVCDLVRLHRIKPVYFENGVEYDLIPFEGFSGYTIAYPADDSEVYDVALQLKDAFAENGTTLEVSTDGSGFFKGIYLSISNGMGAAEYVTVMEEDAIVISAGNKNSLLCAVEQLLRYSLDNYVATVRGASDYDEAITLSSGNTYAYVWGDEFYGTSLDTSKWVCNVNNSKMSGTTDLKLLDTEEAVSVANGVLRLRAMEYTDPDDENIKYAVPASVHTQGTMEYRYGYAEIRAKVPFTQGVWPSFWAQSSTKLGGRQCTDYMVEVDIFEIFGNVNTVVPNIHKWYSSSYNYNEIHGTSLEKNHTQIATKDKYQYTDYTNLSNEYHIYGFEWTPTEMSMYVDGHLYETFDITTSYDLNEDMSGFRDPLFLIFNNHIFTPESTYKPNLITGNEAALPADYDIDWLRIYQADEVEDTQLWTK